MNEPVRLHSSSALICAVLVVDQSTHSMSSAPRMSRARGRSRNFSAPRLRSGGWKDLAGLAVESSKTQGGGPLAQSAERTRPVEAIVCVGPEIAIDELTFEG